MKTMTLPRVTTKTKKKAQQNYLAQIKEYYEIAGPDYQTWSKNFNMHFGYLSQWTDIFRREKMLNQMTEQVMHGLELNSEEGSSHKRKKNSKSKIVLDLGCGLGAATRCMAQKFPQHQYRGFSIVPWQIEQAQKLSVNFQNVKFIEADYRKLPVADNSVDAVFCIESACYAGGFSKGDLMHEIIRVLKPGGRFVIADGFLKHERSLPAFLNKVYNKLCKAWAISSLACLDSMTDIVKTKAAVQVKDISWNVAASVSHVPALVLKFIAQSLWRRKKLHSQNWNNLTAPLMTMILGLSRKHFGYYIVKGKKNETPKPKQSR